MGACFSSDDEIHQRELESLEKIRERENVVEKKRQCTDVLYIILLGIFLVLLFGFLGYLLANSDIYRIINGYDDCGNICGRTNKKVKEFECTGEDMSEKRYLRMYNDTSVDIIRKECVYNCSDYSNQVMIGNRCFQQVKRIRSSKNNKLKNNDTIVALPPENQSVQVLDKGKSFLEEVNEDFRHAWFEMTMLFLLAIVLVGIIMVLFRYATKFTVWFLLIGSVLFLVLISIYLWVMWVKVKKEAKEKSLSDKEDESWTYLTFAIVFSIASLLCLLMVVLMRKKIQLVIQLIKEAGKAIITMPAIMFEPLLTILALGTACGVWLFVTVMGMSAGILTKHNYNILDYDMNPFMSFTLWFNLFMLYWIIQFIIGCQHMTVAGSVARWYFSSNKNALNSPILSSLATLVKYHMGTVAFGSLIIAIIQFIKTLMNMLKNSVKKDNAVLGLIIGVCVNCVLQCIEEIIKFFSRNAYIQTAIYGHPFCRAGKRAFSMLSKNIFNVLAINTIGDTVLDMAKVFIIVITLLVGFEVLKDKEQLHHMWFLLIVIAVFVWLVTYSFITVYEMTIDTIFMCFCEDCALNDGETRPYYMSKDLMNFVEESNRILGKPNVIEESA